MIDINYVNTRQHPETVKKWGVVKTISINKLLDDAVDLIINKTDEVLLYAGLSETFSKLPDKPVVFIDCRGHNRYYVNEDDVKKDEVPKPKLWNIGKK